MLLLSAKPVVEKHSVSLAERVQKLKKRERAPKLAVVLIGSDPASAIYTSNKGKRALELGMEHLSVTLPSETDPREAKKKIQELNHDPGIDGVLIQRPLPPQFSEEEVVYWIDPEKDVDASHPVHAGRLSIGLPGFLPCTPMGIMILLEHYKIQVAGKVACVVGRSNIVGKPMAALLLRENATVIHAHSKTPDLPKLSRQADLIVSAVGKDGFIQKEHVKPGAVVIDVGINRGEGKKVRGDVDFEEVSKIASAITPVPGGVGPMTILGLMSNTVRSAEIRLGIPGGN